MSRLSLGNGLVKVAGHYLYLSLDGYHFYFKFFLGVDIDEQGTIVALSVVCNVVYCTLMLIGFSSLPREFMIKVGLLTILIGPAVVLLLLAFLGATIVCMALYPGYFVLLIWIIDFVKGELVQRVGKYLGLDQDNDGDVDLEDIFLFFANSSLGRSLGLKEVHAHVTKEVVVSTGAVPSPPKEPHAVVTTHEVDAERFDEFLKVVVVAAKASRNEHGCLRFDVHQVQKREQSDAVKENIKRVCMVYAIYTDDGCQRSNEGSDHYRKIEAFKMDGKEKFPTATSYTVGVDVQASV